jgi:RNA polymerase sigma factor (sigma-70 family)
MSASAARDALKDLAAGSVVDSLEEVKLEEIRVSSQETPEDLVIARETLNEFMNQLDESDRQMLSLSIEGYDLGEIADRLALSYSNVGVRLHRSRERLVGVGIAIARDPLRRSGRALLTHPAPALGTNAQAL